MLNVPRHHPDCAFIAQMSVIIQTGDRGSAPRYPEIAATWRPRSPRKRAGLRSGVPKSARHSFTFAVELTNLPRQLVLSVALNHGTHHVSHWAKPVTRKARECSPGSG